MKNMSIFTTKNVIVRIFAGDISPDKFEGSVIYMYYLFHACMHACIDVYIHTYITLHYVTLHYIALHTIHT